MQDGISLKEFFNRIDVVEKEFPDMDVSVVRKDSVQDEEKSS